MKKTILLLCVVLLLFSCRARKEYNKASQINTIQTWEAYLQNFPDSRFTDKATAGLNDLKELKAWNEANDKHTIPEYEGYLKKYPEGKYSSEANAYLQQLKTERTAWEKTLLANNKPAFEHFIETYPSSLYVEDARQQILEINMESDWLRISSSESIDTVRAFRLKYPDGKFSEAAAERILFLEKYFSDWQRLSQNPDIASLHIFIENYPETNNSELAREQLNQLDEQAWQEACSEHSIEAYNSYLEVLPAGLHATEAEEKIVDLEVEAIFRGDYGSMPPMDKIRTLTGNSTMNQIEIYNNTSYNLTLLYSGPKSIKIIISPKERQKFELPNGKYRIAASVDASNVGNFAGTEKLEGGFYSVEYYIYTRYY